MKTTFGAYHNDARIKNKYLKRVRDHAAKDDLVKGNYWENGKGCAVGCTIHSSDHSAYETELGIPEVLAWLEDRIFEELPNADAMLWPERFLSAIRPGADLSLVWPKFAVWLLVDETAGSIRHAKTPAARAAIEKVASLYTRMISGVKIERKEWAAAAHAAFGAARDAAAHAAHADAAHASAGDAAAHAAAAAGASAASASASADADACTAVTAVYSDGWIAARKRSFKRQSKKLLKLLAAA